MSRLMTNLDLLPNVIVIGAMKCATTAVHRYLELHPEISMAAPKEIDRRLEKIAVQRVTDDVAELRVLTGRDLCQWRAY